MVFNFSKKFVVKFSLVLFLSIFVSACGGGGGGGPSGPSSGDGVLQHKIFSPYGDLLDEQQGNYFTGVSAQPSTTVIVSRYRDFGSKYDAGALGIFPEPYCRIGGDYTFYLKNDPKVVGTTTVNNRLYYCKTLNDLLKDIKIPSSWTNKDIVMYCNDGNLINFQNHNIDFLTTKLNNYKVCILKNLDVNDGGTIVYGFEVGNRLLDDNQAYMLNTGNGAGPLTSAFAFKGSSGGKYVFEHAGKSYYMTYDNYNKYYAFADSNIGLDTPFTSVFGGYSSTGDFKHARMAFFASYSNGRKAWGHDIPMKYKIPGVDSLKSVYKIQVHGLNSNSCVKMLASYSPKITGALGAGTMVACSGNIILLNSAAIDGSFGQGSALNLFKNIVTEMRDDVR